MYSSLSVITPADPLIPIEQVRRHIRVDTTDEDDLLAIYLATATALAEQFLGRALGTQTLQWVMAQSQPPEQFPMVPFTAFILPLWLPYSMLFHRAIEIPRAPVQSILSVATGTWCQPDVTLVAGQFDADLSTEPARLRIYSGFGFPSDHVIVQFTAGYAAGAVPATIINAILLMTAFLYENRGDAEAEMPSVARALLWPSKLQFFGG